MGRTDELMAMQLMRLHGVGHQEIADHLGLTRSAVSRKLRGERPWYLAEAFKVREYLQGVSGEHLSLDTLFRDHKPQ